MVVYVETVHQMSPERQTTSAAHQKQAVSARMAHAAVLPMIFVVELVSAVVEIGADGDAAIAR